MNGLGPAGILHPARWLPRLVNAAAVAVGKVGTAFVFPDELRSTLDGRGECV
jgi:hypothetical protein